uniref:Kinesin-like calmodulin binding protein n=1 Tax=Tetraselmis sp. GSL018 TaxID=582737 RepID=A0A061S9G2_9CHLO
MSAAPNQKRGLSVLKPFFGSSKNPAASPVPSPSTPSNRASPKSLGFEDAKLKLQRIARLLPYGGSSFWNATTVVGPSNLFPQQVVLGVNKRGVHFFNPDPKKYLFSFETFELLDVAQHTPKLALAVLIAGTRDTLLFETEDAEEICDSIQNILKQHETTTPYSRTVPLPEREVRSPQRLESTWSHPPQELRHDSDIAREGSSRFYPTSPSRSLRSTQRSVSRERRSPRLAEAKLEEDLRRAVTEAEQQRSRTQEIEARLAGISNQPKRTPRASDQYVQELRKQLLKSKATAKALLKRNRALRKELLEKEEQRKAHDYEVRSSRERTRALEQELARVRTQLRAAQGERDRLLQHAADSETLRKLYRDESLLRKKYFGEIQEMKGKIRVVARVRKPLPGENPEGISVSDGGTVSLRRRGEEPQQFTLDAALGPSEGQEAVYSQASPLVRAAAEGVSLCVMAYGQPRSGKSFTMFGTEAHPGVAPRAVQDLFAAASQRLAGVAVRIGALELRGSRLRDLLRADGGEPPPLSIRKDPHGVVHVEGQSLEEAAGPEEAAAAVRLALSRLSPVGGGGGSGAAPLSHVFVSVHLEATHAASGATVRSKLSLVELAGAPPEAGDRSADDDGSLAALRDVVSALASGSAAVPYTRHRLTALLSDSLGGNARTLVLATLSPAAEDAAAAHEALRHAVRMRTVRNAPRPGLETAELRRLREQVEHLRQHADLPPELEDLQARRSIDDRREAPIGSA